MHRAEEWPIEKVAEWFYGACSRWPEAFVIQDMSLVWGWAAEEAESTAHFVELLRAGLLKRLWKAVGECERCPLAEFRGITPVLDDGDWDADPFAKYGDWPAPVGPTSAEIMVIGIGPGQFEQVTGQPLVGYYTLAGSFCARYCARYEECFPEGCSIPAQPCDYLSLGAEIYAARKDAGTDLSPESIEAERAEIFRERLAREPWLLHTAGTLLDKVLLDAGHWRESWNPRLRANPELAEPQAGSVYVANLVKCRSCVPDPRSHDGVKDEDPTPEMLAACRTWLDAQLYIIQPRVLVTLGALATQTLTQLPTVKITSEAVRQTLHAGPEAYVAPERRIQLPVLANVHPSFILHKSDPNLPKGQLSRGQQDWIADLVGTFERARDLTEGKEAWDYSPAGSEVFQQPSTRVFGEVLAAAPPPDPSDLPFCPTWPEGYQPAGVSV